MSTARPLFEPEPPRDPKPPTPPARHAPRRWLHVAGWIGGAIVALLILIAITVTILFNSRHFHDYVLSKAQRVASDKLGARVQLQNYVLHLSTLSLDVYGVTVHGASPYPDPPLLQLQHAQVGVRIVSLLGGKW